MYEEFMEFTIILKHVEEKVQDMTRERIVNLVAMLIQKVQQLEAQIAETQTA